MSPLIRFPDVSGFTPSGMTYGGLAVVCAKATQGTSYVNPQYKTQIARAHQANAFGFSYHFLEDTHPEGQAEHAFSQVGKGALMVDHEPWPGRPGGGSFPTLRDLYTFIDHYRHIGGVTHITYFPEWYWTQRGRPDLGGLRDRNIYLWSSNYPREGYSDNGPGWDAYGGSHPLVWQYTDRQLFNGARLDFSAFKGTGAEFRRIMLTGRRNVVADTFRTWETKGHSSLKDVSDAVGMAPSSILRRTVEKFGPFDDVISHYVNDVIEGRKLWEDIIPPGGKLWVRDPGVS